MASPAPIGHRPGHRPPRWRCGTAGSLSRPVAGRGGQARGPDGPRQRAGTRRDGFRRRPAARAVRCARVPRAPTGPRDQRLPAAGVRPGHRVDAGQDADGGRCRKGLSRGLPRVAGAVLHHRPSAGRRTRQADEEAGAHALRAARDLRAGAAVSGFRHFALRTAARLARDGALPPDPPPPQARLASPHRRHQPWRRPPQPRVPDAGDPSNVAARATPGVPASAWRGTPRGGGAAGRGVRARDPLALFET